MEDSHNYFGVTKPKLTPVFNSCLISKPSHDAFEIQTQTPVTDKVQGILHYEQASHLWEHIKNRHSSVELIAAYLG